MDCTRILLPTLQGCYVLLYGHKTLLQHFTWLQKSPMFSWKMVDFSRLILISLETVQRLRVANQMVRYMIDTLPRSCGHQHYRWDNHNSSLPSRFRVYQTRTDTNVAHCSWMCCWKLGRLRSFRARRRIFFSSSVSFFCPISFNLAAASIHNTKAGSG